MKEYVSQLLSSQIHEHYDEEFDVDQIFATDEAFIEQFDHHKKTHMGSDWN